MDTEEASNWYQIRETGERIKKRVTDLVKAWYRRVFPDKQFTPEEKAFNEFKRKEGIKGHKWFQEIHNRFFNNDGTKRDKTGERPNIPNKIDEEIYLKLEAYYIDLMKTFFKDGKTPLVFSEVMLYSKKKKQAGTIDLLIIDEDGRAHIIDWKFMTTGEKSTDVAWYKQGAYNIQLREYKDMLISDYGIKEIGMNRAIPILFKIDTIKDKHILKGIVVGSVDASKIKDLTLLHVSEETETTGEEKLDVLIRELNSVFKNISAKKVTDDKEREYKRERLNILRQAIRMAQGTGNIKGLVDVIGVMRKEGQMITDDWETKYKDRSAKDETLTEDELSDFAENMLEYKAIAGVFGDINLLIDDLIYNPTMDKDAKTKEQKEELTQRKEILAKIVEETTLIKKSKIEIDKISGLFADKFEGQRHSIAGLLKEQPILKGLWSTFRGVADLALPSLQILNKMVTNAKGKASQDALAEVDELLAIRKKLVDRGGDLKALVQRIYQRDDKGSLVNKLIHKYKKDFYTGVDANAAEGVRSMAWLKDNVDLAAYKEEADKMLNTRIERMNKLYDENTDLRDRLVLEERQKWDVTRNDFTGYNNYIIKRHPLAKWYSEEYTELKKDSDLLELYDFIHRMNEKAKESGYIGNRVASTFLPFIRRSMAESIAWDFNISAITNWSKNLTLRADDVGYGKVNELTHEYEYAIPKYFTYDFSRQEDGTNDYSDVSEDIFKNMIMYVNHMEKYKYLSAIEGQLLLVKNIEQFKKHLATNIIGDVVDENGKPKVEEGNEENARMYDLFLRAVLYEQKYPLSNEDVPLGFGKAINFVKEGINRMAGREVFHPSENPSATSLMKSIDAVNRAMQLKTLGFEFISGAVNWFGGNIQVATQAGNYFKAGEVFANETKLIGNSFRNDDERKMFIQLIDMFMPLKDDPTYERLKEAGMSRLTRHSFTDFLMVFMRKPEEHIEKTIFLTLLQNMMVENGKIISIREYVKKKYADRYSSADRYREARKQMEDEIEELKKTRSIDAIKELKDDKLIIPGLDITNRDELQRLTDLTRRISRNATGALTASAINKMNMNIWTKSMMVFKNWIPTLLDTRFGEFRRVSDDFSTEVDEDGLTTGEKYDVGRIRLWTYVIGSSIRDMSINTYNILALNEKGIKALDKMYEDFADKYQRRNGEPLEMSREDFIDLIRNNLRNQMKELAMLLTLMGAGLSLGFIAPDDDDSKADKNFFRFSQRVIDKFVTELSFFYNPAEFQKLLSGGMFPAMGLTADILRFTNHFTMEVTGYDISNPLLTAEEVRKKAQPVKNAAKIFPFTKSLVTYGAILSDDFAKEFDVTIQKESRR
jgi:hypothetical protein